MNPIMIEAKVSVSYMIPSPLVILRLNSSIYWHKINYGGMPTSFSFYEQWVALILNL